MKYKEVLDRTTLAISPFTKEINLIVTEKKTVSHMNFQ